MITIEDVSRVIPQLKHLSPDQIRRLTNAENCCKLSKTDWSKQYWFDVFKKLCKMYSCMDYFRKVMH